MTTVEDTLHERRRDLAQALDDVKCRLGRA
jgi:hypothetical protein